MPLAFGAFLPVVTDAARAAAVVGMAVLSSVIPYALEQLVLRRVTAARFAILLAMLPVTAALIGAVLLAPVPERRSSWSALPWCAWRSCCPGSGRFRARRIPLPA